MNKVNHARLFNKGNKSGPFHNVTIFADHYLSKEEIDEFEQKSFEEMEQYSKEKHYDVICSDFKFINK